MNKDKKKKIFKIIVLIALIIAAIIGGKYYLDKKEELKETKEVLAELENGSTYYYSEEEIQEFIAASTKLMEKEVKKYNLEPGISRLETYQIEMATRNGWVTVEKATDDYKHLSYNGFSVSDPDIENDDFVLYNKFTKAEEIFNKDLSLRDVYAFYGYTGVQDTSLEYVRTDKLTNERFNKMVYALRYWDNKYKNSSINEIVDEIIGYDIEFIATGVKKTSSVDEKTGVQAYFLSKFVDTKQNSMNRLQQLYKVDKVWNIDSIFGHLVRGYYLNDQPALSYEPFPAEFNYWEVEGDNYFTEYYPVSVTKFRDDIYIVNIETVKPVNLCAAVEIANNISSRFKDTSPVEYTGDNLHVIVSVNDSIYHDMTPGILNKDVYQVGGMLDDQGNLFVADAEAAALSWRFEWHPSSEAQPWVDRYFEIASEAYEADSRFSIFETIELVSEEFEVEYDDVESVIMTTYWMYNNMIPYGL